MRLAKDNKDDRTTLSVGLKPKAREVVDQIKEETGIAKQEAVARVFEWFAEQPPSVRREVLTAGGNAGAELMRLRMADMLAAGQADPATIKTVEDATRVIRLMLERIEQIDAARLRHFKGGKEK